MHFYYKNDADFRDFGLVLLNFEMFEKKSYI